MSDLKGSKIEDIKGHLYDREDQGFQGRHFEGKLSQIGFKTKDDWEENQDKKEEYNQIEMKKPKSSIFKKFFIISIIFFIGALGFAFYKFYTGEVSVSNEKIDIIVLGNAFTKGGDELPLQIEIVNRNNASLELANLIVSYPGGVSDDISGIIRLPRDSIGTIKAGESVVRNVKVKLFGEEQSIRNILISLEYHPEGSNAIFTKEKEYPVTISSSPLSLFITAPESVTSDQNVSLEVKAVLNTSLPEGPTALELSYPNNFIFENAIPNPTFGNNVWSLESLSVTNPFTVVVNGRLVGQDGDEQIFHAYAGATNPKNQAKVNIAYNSLLHSVLIEKPFLEAKILVNGQDKQFFTASAGDQISGEIYWVNNLSTRIADAEIIVGLSGNVLDKLSIKPEDGFYDSLKNQIIWDKNYISELASVEPGEKGTVSFKFKSISLIGPANYIKDPQIGIDVSIRGRQPGLGSTFSDVNNFSKKVVRIISDFQIVAGAVYSSGFLPPKAEAETKYVVTWTLSNSSNTISQAEARAVLPIYVNWGGSLTGGNENVSYNEVTREVIWNIGTVRPNTGFDSNREASFVVSLKPSLSQVGSVPQLTKEVFLSGQDSFSLVLIKNKYNAITTFLPNDPNFSEGKQRVVR